MTFKEIQKIILNDGWYLYKTVGSHYQFKHNIKPGKITIPRHCKELKKAVVNSILKQAQLKDYIKKECKK